MEKLGYIKRLRPVFLVGIIALITYMAIKNTKEDNKEVEALNREYPNINQNDYMCGKIKNYSTYRGAVLLTLENNYKTCINTSRNYGYTPPYLEKFIKVGDSVIKNAYSDTLHIIRNEQKYFFIIGEFIGEDPSPKYFRYNKE